LKKSSNNIAAKQQSTGSTDNGDGSKQQVVVPWHSKQQRVMVTARAVAAPSAGCSECNTNKKRTIHGKNKRTSNSNGGGNIMAH